MVVVMAIGLFQLSARSEYIQPVDVKVSNGEGSKGALIEGEALDDGPVGSPTSTHAEGEGMWNSVGSTKAEAVFDLGKTVDLTKVYLWNYNGSETDQGMRDVQVLISSDSDINTTNFTGIAEISLTEGGTAVQTFNVTGTEVRLVKLKCVRNWGHGFAVGLAEARFESGQIEGSVPVVIIDGLKDGDAILSGKDYTLKVKATDKDNDLSKVEFYDGAIKTGEVTRAPFQWIHKTVASGEHTFRVVGTDKAGHKSFSTVDVLAKEVVNGRIEQIDDTAGEGTGQNQISYSTSGWTLAPGNANDPRFQQNDHYASASGAFYELKFVGVKVEVYATVASHHGTAKASIDGGTEFTINFKAAQRGEQVLVWSSAKLPNKEHTLKVTATGDGVITADRFDVQISEIVQVDDEADIGDGLNQIKYTGAWNLAPGNASDPRFKNNDHYTDVKGATYEVRFIGVKIDVFATVASHHGTAKATIDGGTEYIINQKLPQRGEQVHVFSSPLLQNKEHVLKVTVAGDGVVTADRFDIETVAANSKDLAFVRKWTAKMNEFVVELENTAASKVVVDSLRLTIDGATARFDSSSSGNSLLISHKPSAPFAPGSDHPFKLQARDGEGNNVGTEATFSIPRTPFPIAGLGGPKSADGNWGIRQIWRGGRADALVTAVGIAGAATRTPFTGRVYDTNAPVVNFAYSLSPGAGGIFPDDHPFPAEGAGATSVDIVLVGRALVRIPRAGDWTIGVHSEKGFGLRVSEVPFVSVSGLGRIDENYPEYLIQPNPSADSNTRGVLKVTAAGDYLVELISWNRTGAANVEMYSAEGAFAEDSETDTWKLIGAEGGWTIVAEKSAIGPIVLGKVTLNGGVFGIEFESAAPAASHQLLQTTDFKSWTPAPGATVESTGASKGRITVNASAANQFYRVSAK